MGRRGRGKPHSRTSTPAAASRSRAKILSRRGSIQSSRSDNRRGYDPGLLRRRERPGVATDSRSRQSEESQPHSSAGGGRHGTLTDQSMASVDSDVEDGGTGLHQRPTWMRETQPRSTSLPTTCSARPPFRTCLTTRIPGQSRPRRDRRCSWGWRGRGPQRRVCLQQLPDCRRSGERL